jgi:hypothetical protein
MNSQEGAHPISTVAVSSRVASASRGVQSKAPVRDAIGNSNRWLWGKIRPLLTAYRASAKSGAILLAASKSEIAFGSRQRAKGWFAAIP